MTPRLQIPYLPLTLTPNGIEITFANQELHHSLIVILESTFLLNVTNADNYLVILCVILLAYCFKKLHAFRVPPPVHKKKLPRRPALQILFKPDNIASSMNPNIGGVRGTRGNNNDDNVKSVHSARSKANQKHGGDGQWETNIKTNVQGNTTSSNTKSGNEEFKNEINPEIEAYEDDDISSIDDQNDFMSIKAGHSTTTNHFTYNDISSISNKKSTPIMKPLDLPDSFAPLLSSSRMEILTDQLTSDLLHATHVEGSIRLRKGRHEIPLDKDTSRPQLVLDVPLLSGCKLTAVASIGSDGLSNIDDMDISKQTNERSSPLVKHAGIILDPPLPLVNVAPTLIHFPTLFEDNVVKYTLRQIQIVRYALDLINSASSFIEKVLWIIESKCQIHLGKVSVTPLYKGVREQKYVQQQQDQFISTENDDHNTGVETAKMDVEPQWRLSLAFSGHVLLFGWIPIPFVNITLPTWIIPQPHALVEKLLTKQPLASAKLRREHIAEKRITLAVLDTVEAWDFKLGALATPPALSADLVLPGGISVAVETMHGTDVSGGRPRGGVEAVGHGNMANDASSIESMSECTMYTDTQRHRWFHKRRLRKKKLSSMKQMGLKVKNIFDANDLVPWKLEVLANGRVGRDKITLNLSKFVASHDPSVAHDHNDGTSGRSNISLSGHFIICKPDAELMDKSPSGKRLSSSRLSLNGEHTKLQSDDISVAAILLFTEKKSRSNRSRRNNLLQYDYEFDIGEDTSLDAISLSVGASHPMLKGGTIITTILEHFYAYGTIGARPNSVIDMSELSRKRNILKHLPAIGLTAGIQNFFIPEESFSYSDDGQTKCLPELGGGQLMIRMTGGYSNNPLLNSKKNMSSTTLSSTRNSRENSRNSKTIQDAAIVVNEGIKVVVDFGIASVVLNNESNSFEFPELEIFDDQKLQSLLNGSIDGSIRFHLRPQDWKKTAADSVLKANIFNPLERFEIDFSGSKVFLKIVESNATLGHRRIIIPSETTVGVSVVESVVDMSFDGSTQCEFHWDFQGASPILQVTENIGESPQFVCHEDRQQVPLLISSLRQGRFNLNVSSVGGLTITQAATSREHREGLYDWKFFNAIVSPDEHSFDHMVQVLHDKRTMFKILQVVKLINAKLEKFMCYGLKQVWRAKEIFDEEGVSDPGKAIPSYKMARLMSLFLCGSDEQVEEILPIVRRAVEGDGIDVIAVKELLRKNMRLYDEWAPEIDRAVKWVEVMLGSQEAPKPFVENNVTPLSLTPKYRSQFSAVGIPSARELYAVLLEKQHLPLALDFSSLVSRIAPYLSFKQIEYILQTRSPTDWQAPDIRRLRYVYSIKKKVLDISESYGGLSFMPQSFFVSVFLGEATRASLRARDDAVAGEDLYINPLSGHHRRSSYTTLQNLRQRQTGTHRDHLSISQGNNMSRTVDSRLQSGARSHFRSNSNNFEEAVVVGDSLLGPQDVAILLQAGLTSSMKGSTVVQLNQRMLLDLMASQPRLFAVAVLAEIGSPGGEGNPRGLTSALMALLDLDQSSFNEFHRLDMHHLLESWLPGLTMPRRDDYLAGGRWASQSYYSAVFGVSKNILEDAESYIALKHHVQRVRHSEESAPIPTAKELDNASLYEQQGSQHSEESLISGVHSFDSSTKLSVAIEDAKRKIQEADEEGQKVYESLKHRRVSSKECKLCIKATQKYEQAFTACARVLLLDKLSFHTDWFKSFYRRNYDALMVKSVYDNVINDDDDVRVWLGKLRKSQHHQGKDQRQSFPIPIPFKSNNEDKKENSRESLYFDNPSELHEQEIVDEIIDLIFFDRDEREKIRSDPLTRLLLSNPPGNYDFTIVSAMGVITEGKKGIELETALCRLKEQRGVEIVRSDTGTARSFEYNASKIEDAIEVAVQLDKPYGLLGYSQGCANGLFCESLLQSGTPLQQSRLTSKKSYLACRQLLFSAANGSQHGPAMEAKIHRLIVMCEQFFKYQQGYFSRAFTKTVLESLTDIMDSAAFQKFVAGGGGTFLHDGSRAFWREAQHLNHVPTCVMRGVLEEHTTPESLQMISNFLSKHAGSPLHDSQVHVYDAVGCPIYTHNRNSKILKQCDMGGAIQRTHHWSPLSDEVKFVETQQDIDRGTFLCAKDRHIFPWCDVNARFGFIKYESRKE